MTKPFDQITKEYIEILVANRVLEGKTIEYKEKLPGVGLEDRKEFLADVSSFANTTGGLLFYGITEKRSKEDGQPTNEPEEARGLKAINIATEKGRLESMLQDGLEPRVAGVQIRPIDGFKEGSIIVIHIPHSYNRPHAVWLAKSSKFWARNSHGKYQMDVDEIRTSFLLSDALPRRIRDFRKERLTLISSGDTPVRMQPGGRLVLHLAPFSAFESAANINLEPLALDYVKYPPPMHSSGMYLRWNFDGLVTYSNPDEKDNHSTYLQVFRNGIFEAVEGRSIYQPDQEKYIRRDYENTTVEILKIYLKILKTELAVEPPFFVMLTLLGTKDAVMNYHIGSGYSRDPEKIDRDQLIVPEIQINSYDQDLHAALKPAFDTVWQAAGLKRSYNYNSEGKWDPQK